MKKLISLLSVAALGFAAVPMTSVAEAYVFDVNRAILGDVNCDGAVDASDAAELLRYYAIIGGAGGKDMIDRDELLTKVPHLAGIELVGDVDGNGSIDGGDAAATLAIYAEGSGKAQAEISEEGFQYLREHYSEFDKVIE
ncbi:MAG: hypothetical protein IJM38_08875 [Ruminococcus sp.]|nr:hypothetical protein [Ruminococcus sp.]